MTTETTEQALAAITDEGLFERLATAILREANPTCHALVHTGVNVGGKTVKSPVDGICFVQSADPPHMIAVHHTITADTNLENKWLHDPSKVKPRGGKKPTAPAGDLIKTAEIVVEERIHTPTMRATLVLTTNQEPGQSTVRAVETAGRERGVEVDIWSRSRLAHFLDYEPTGQWIRRSFLNIEQQLLSFELLRELSAKSLEINCPPDKPAAWIPRELDGTLKASNHRKMTFLVAGSGLGKSVACYRMLAKHVENGGFGLIIPHAVVASAITLEQAVMTALCQLYSHLAAAGTSVLSFCSPEKPLMLVVEDVNRSGQAQLLVEKLANWCFASADEDKNELSLWRLICPLWPEVLTSLGEQARRRIEPLIVTAGSFTKEEGRDAVMARARLAGRVISPLSAEEISLSLGNDPLLIALHNQETAPDPHRVIGQFVEGSLLRTASAAKDNPAADYRQALRNLSGAMLAKRQIELRWREISGWAELVGESLHLLSRLASNGELLRFSGTSEDQRVSFRADRVRDWLLADAAAELECKGLLVDQVIAEPYFAEVMGAALVWGPHKSNLLQRIATLNPLALFYAFRSLSRARESHQEAILLAITEWLDNPTTHDRSNLHLRWSALALLEQTDNPKVPEIVCKFRDQMTIGPSARFRNGDLTGGIYLCFNVEPGVGAPWRDIQIEHAKLQHGESLVKALDRFFRQTPSNVKVRIGALRLAGHFADSRLAKAIEACWLTDDKRGDLLAEYLWAFGECCGSDPARFLGPVCDAWAALSDRSDKAGMPSARQNIAADQLRWAFQKWPPISAIDYFIERGSREDLRWPIVDMLHGIDSPNAILFVVRELAALRRRSEGSRSVFPFVSSARDDWRRAQEDRGRPMSKASRDVLLGLWRDETNDKHLRVQAFSFWAATQDSEDIEVLRNVNTSSELADSILSHRLTLGDQNAIAAMIDKLKTDKHGYWWQLGRHVWSPELTEVLDKSLGYRGEKAKYTWDEYIEPDGFVSEMVMRLPVDDAERLLLKHWSHLRFGADFVQAALYVSTPRLLEAAQVAISECPMPAKLLEHIGYGFGIRMTGHPGITRESQVRALAPFLHLLSSLDIHSLWRECNDHGWFTLRRELLDDRLQEPFLWQKWRPEQAASDLDKMIQENRLHSLDYWIDGFVTIGVTWTEIFNTMVAWLDQQRSFTALQAVAIAVEHLGTREDLGALKIYDGMSPTEAGQLIADARFAVYRRSIR